MNTTKILVLSILITLSACSTHNSNVKIGFLADTFEIARWQKDRQYFEEKVEELGGSVIVKSANGDDAQQLKLAQELIDQGVKVLVVVATNANSAAAIVRLAHKNNVKVIAYARLIKNCDLDYFITFNVEKIGTLQADYVKSLKPRGTYVLINGDKADINAQIEHSGVIKSLQTQIKSGDIKLLYDAFIEGWAPDNAEHLMKKIIEFGNEPIDAIIVGNDGMATGVYEALSEYGLSGEVLLTGLDAEPIALKRILNGDQTMTVYMSIKKLAYANAELAVKIAKNQKIKMDFKFTDNGRVKVPTIVLEPQIVDKSNIETTVIAENYVTMKDIDESSY
ncbi:MAG: substrate-binding domain-containing protein [Bacteroidales bacterium]|nr:substrate-binding domain-containing protein [Bacteroidales bacterium]